MSPTLLLGLMALGGADVEPGAAAAVRYEPLHQLEIDQRFTLPGFDDDEGTVRKTLDYASWRSHVLYRAIPPQGFAAKRTKRTVTWRGKEVPGELMVWSVDRSRGWRRVNVGRVEIERSDSIPAPHFMMTVESTDEIPIPAGTLRLRAEPDPTQTLRTWAIDYAHVGPRTHCLRDWAVEADEFRWRIDVIDQRTKERSEQSRGRIVLSDDVVGGVCSLWERKRVMDGFSTSDQTLRAVTVLPVPEGIRAFPEYGFGLAPPAGYRFVAAERGEVARLVHERGFVITIRARDRRGLGVEEWWKANAPKDADPVRLQLNGRDTIGPFDIAKLEQENNVASGRHMLVVRYREYGNIWGDIAEQWRWISDGKEQPE